MNRKDIVKCAVFLAVLALFVLVVSRLGNTQQDSETEMVYEAVKNAALTCYAVEGAFPSDVTYLCDHYGLLYDKERFLVSYEAFASNVMPDIGVLERGTR